MLVTAHLRFSLPYRALFSQTLRPDTATRLVDALAVLLVRLHIVGFFWGDVSLSNTLFRRDAGAFAAYLVDAETGKLYEGGLSNGQRENDLEIARSNIAGELLDLEAGGRVADELDPVNISDGIVEAYRSLWTELTGPESFGVAERWRINERVNRLNDLGFDIEELAISTDETGTTVRIQPKVVDAGHHQRRLLRLTGLDVGREPGAPPAQRPRLVPRGLRQGPTDEEMVAHEWLMRVFEPVVRAIPWTCAASSSPPRCSTSCSSTAGSWRSRRARHPARRGVSPYINDVLRHRARGDGDRPADRRPPPRRRRARTSAIAVVDPDDEEDWRLKVWGDDAARPPERGVRSGAVDPSAARSFAIS